MCTRMQFVLTTILSEDYYFNKMLPRVALNLMQKLQNIIRLFYVLRIFYLNHKSMV